MGFDHVPYQFGLLDLISRVYGLLGSFAHYVTSLIVERKLGL